MRATLSTVRATAADVPTLGRTLARAFHDDPVFSWVVPDHERRRALLPAVFETFAEVYLLHEETYLLGDGVGAALWAPDGVAPLPAELEAWFGARQEEILGQDANRAFRLGELLEQHHPEQPCFYLQFVGILPAQHGRGLGSRLLASGLRRRDAAGLPCYLEATSSHNRRLYERHGFEVFAELSLPDGPPLWPMWRVPEPAPPTT